MNFIGQCDFLIAFVDAGESHLYLTLGLAIGKDKKILLVPRAEAELPPTLDNVDKIVSDSHNEQLIFQILEHVGRCQIDFQLFLRSYTHYPEFFGDFNNKTLVDIVSQGCELKGYSPEINTDPTRPGYDILLRNYQGFDQTLVELKKYNLNDKVSIGEIQQLLGAVNLYRAGCGTLTSSHFTRSARDFATRLDGRIELWAVDKLIEVTKDVISIGIEVGLHDLEQIVHAHQNAVLRHIQVIIKDVFQHAAAGSYDPESDVLFRRVLNQIELSRELYKGFIGRQSGKDICAFLKEEFTPADLKKIFDRLLRFLPSPGEDPEAKYLPLKQLVDAKVEEVFGNIFKNLRALESKI